MFHVIHDAVMDGLEERAIPISRRAGRKMQYGRRGFP